MQPIRELYDQPAALEQLFPSDPAGALREMAAELLRKSGQLGGMLHPVTRASVVSLLRIMNSYYSNLIEGHNTHPLAIEKALRDDYACRRAESVDSDPRAQYELILFSH